MLARVAARSLRLYSSPAPIQSTLPSFQFRHYAKHNKPKRPFEYRPPTTSNSANRHGPTAQRPGGPLAGSAGHQQNSQPSTQPRSDVPFDKLAETSSHPEYSTLQGEFQTSAPSDGNTAPQSSSPSAIDPAEVRRQEFEQEPSQPLPDLTQGIPSTLDSELASSSSVHSDPKSLNITEDPSGSGGQGAGDLPKSAYISSIERRRNKSFAYLFGGAILALGFAGVYQGRNWESEEEELAHPDAPSGWGLKLFFNRIWARYNTTLDYYNEPAFPKLLPSVDPTWERPYTLVLSLEDMLVHSEWSREHGWRMAKRPGVDYFLRYLSHYYELVVFTSVPSMLGGPIIQKLDPYKVIMWPLFREATRYKNGEYIKDLSFLNRDLSKIILVDTEPSHAKLQPENAIILPKWKGDLKDKGLVSLIPFLEFVGADIKDTREVLKSFEGTDIPTEFARREAVHREKFLKEMGDSKAKRPNRSIGILGSLLGAKPQPGMDGMESLSEGFDQGKTYNDMVRERGQKQYEILEKEIRENGEKWLKEMAEEEKKMQDEAMKGIKSGIVGFFPFGGGSSGSGKPA